MRVLALVLLIVGAALLVPELRGMVPRIRFEPYVWQWISFVSIGFAVVLWFLAPRND